MNTADRLIASALEPVTVVRSRLCINCGRRRPEFVMRSRFVGAEEGGSRHGCWVWRCVEERECDRLATAACRSRARRLISALFAGFRSGVGDR